MRCGTQLRRPCPNCGTDLPLDARFCLNCGLPLGEATPADSDRLARAAAATPASLARKIRAADSLSGERRVVTVLFADVVGSTALAGRMDPEEWTQMMNRAFDRLIPTVYQYEGTIARLMGDAILAFFGAPVAHEDDPVRAVRAAQDLVEAARRFGSEVEAQSGHKFEVRVGLNTGKVVVGAVGNDLVYEYTAMGDAVNLAARLQAAARPMTVLISESTRRFVEPVFELKDQGKIELKGKDAPFQVYEVLGERESPMPVRGLAGLVSPMVGRDRDLDAALRASRAVTAGIGRAILILGEPGLGKSRLVAEWRSVSRKNISGAPPLRWLTGHCLSYGHGQAYHLVMDLLRSCLEVPAGAQGAEVQRSLDQKVSALFGEQRDDIYPYLAHLLNLDLESERIGRVANLDPQSLQMHYLAAFRKLLAAMAAEQPLGLVLEDVHWADPSSIELVVRLLPLTAETPLLFCIVTRPNRDVPGWRLVEAVREFLGDGLVEINLTALSEADSRQLVSNLLEIEALPEHVRRVILEKAEGVPFFVEEVIRMLMDRGALVRADGRWVAGEALETIEIPDNLQGLLLARIDRLSDEAKHVLRVASVIGRQFSAEVLEDVLERQDKDFP